MSKVIRNAEAQLDAFFKKSGLKKKASLGHFSDVHSEEDMVKVGKMVHEMVQLPKYDTIRRELQGASGIVNFVTHDEYEPLVEFVLKTAFPPSSNDVYHMGHDSTLPEDYFVDATEYFGESAGSAKEAAAARTKLDLILKGSPKKITEQWMKDHNVSIQDLNSSIIPVNPEAAAQAAIEGAAPVPPGEAIVAAIKGFSKEWGELQSGPLRRSIDQLYKKIEQNRAKKHSNEKIEEQNAGKPPSAQQALAPVLAEDQVKLLHEELRFKRGLFAGKKQQLLLSYPEINLRDQFSGRIERSGDGFLSWNPVAEIREVYSSLVRSTDETPVIDGMIEMLKQTIKDYRTTDPLLLKKKVQILEFFEKGGEDQVIKWMNHSGTFNSLMNSFIEQANRHGKVVLLTGLEQSALCTPGKEAGDGHYLQDNGLFTDFDSSNSANLLRDRTEGRNTRGKRTMVLISSMPFQRLKGATVVEMDVTPVDEKEAEIIVRHTCAPYVTEARRAVELKMLSTIESKYGNTVDTAKQNQRDRELQGIGQALAKMQDSLGYISPEAKQTMEQMLIGMGQREAIKACRLAVESHVNRKYDEDGIITGLEIDEEGVLNSMIDQTNKAKNSDTLGLEVQKSKVAFDDYITNKLSSWGDLVGDVGFKKKEMAHINEQIKQCRSEISQIDFELMGKIEPATRKSLLNSRSGWESELAMAVAAKNNFMKDFPHFTILYGKPGTGKSVWGDALADLCKLAFYRVDVGKIKDKWVGNTGKFADKMLTSIFSSKNAVFLMDEIDKMLEMGHGAQGGGTDTAHEVTKDVVQKFLYHFGERMNELIERNIFVIMTTNNIEGINTALLERSKGDVYEVQAADRPEDFLKFLSTFLSTERKQNPQDPWIKYGGTTNEAMWDYTEKYIRENIDLTSLANAFADRKLSFRNLSGLMRQACRHHNTYLDSMNAISRGDQIDVHGLPMTTENLIRAAKIAKDASNSNSDYDFGIHTIKVETVTRVREMMKNTELISETVIHPITKKPMQRFRLPDEAMKILNGQSEEEESTLQYDVIEEDIPGGKARALRRPGGTPVNELQDTGFIEQVEEEEPLVQQQKTEPVKENDPQSQKKDQKKGVESSTDYLFKYLQSQGIVSKDGKMVGPKVEEPQPVAKPVEFDSVEKNGVYYYNGGQIFMAPLI